ncbi:hypothetical protein SLEP1_g28153 [Rubroshorea leprosula]|uniref:RNase H type-1 domain-containing protein n=1 Tax=Rubroshorea leprosula TaxID=152421 RepID=A0AAV5K253_9ROSI|nr:hypothetical protein SLEP1_g28153 [Rubroshorea leprosula]
MLEGDADAPEKYDIYLGKKTIRAFVHPVLKDLGVRQVGLGQQFSKTRWSPPDMSHVKINTDGATLGQQQNFGMGVVAHDHAGNVVAAMACKGQRAVATEIVEACSLHKALQWARGLSFDRIILESNCANIVTAMQNDSPSMHSTLGLIIFDSKMLMTSFLSCRFQHIRREGNSVAHELAKRAIQAEADELLIYLSL